SLLKGKIDVSDGYNFISNNSNAMDDSGHGTGVTGIIATNSNVKSKDLIGVTGNLNVEIIPVKVLDSSGTG
ncbi:S8 family serine peptidase, partial [Bacteroides xylanisolvens]